MIKAIRQGDVIIELNQATKKDLKKATKLNHKIIAEGEVTGHKHQLVGNADLFLAEDTMFTEVRSRSKVTHDEHRTVELPPGIHRIDIPQEYDYVSQEKQRVRD